MEGKLDVEWKEQTSLKEVAKAEEMEKNPKSRDEAAGFDCEACGKSDGLLWPDCWCSSPGNFPDCRHTQAIVKEIGVSVQIVTKVKLSSVKPNGTVLLCLHATRLRIHTSWDKPPAVTVRKCGHYLVGEVRGGGGRSYVVTATTKKKK